MCRSAKRYARGRGCTYVGIGGRTNSGEPSSSMPHRERRRTVVLRLSICMGHILAVIHGELEGVGG